MPDQSSIIQAVTNVRDSDPPFVLFPKIFNFYYCIFETLLYFVIRKLFLISEFLIISIIIQLYISYQNFKLFSANYFPARLLWQMMFFLVEKYCNDKLEKIS